MLGVGIGNWDGGEKVINHSFYFHIEQSDFMLVDKEDTLSILGKGEIWLSIYNIGKERSWYYIVC